MQYLYLRSIGCIGFVHTTRPHQVYKMTTQTVWGMQTIALAGQRGLLTLASIIREHGADPQERDHTGVLHAVAFLHAMGSPLAQRIQLVQVPAEYIKRLPIVVTPEGERLDWTDIEGGWDRELTEREIRELIAEAGAARHARKLRKHRFITATGGDLVELVRKSESTIALSQLQCLIAIQRNHGAISETHEPARSQ